MKFPLLISQVLIFRREDKREIYMRPPRGWIASSRELWKLEKPAYCLVASGRILQLCVEDWLLSYGPKQLPGLPQFFYVKEKNVQVVLLTAKVVDDHLLAGSRAKMEEFKNSFSKRL